MSQQDKLKFYAQQSTVEISASQKEEGLRYILSNYPDFITEHDITLKYAFPVTWNISSPVVKEHVRKILVSLLNISQFTVDSRMNHAEILIPFRKIDPTAFLPDEVIEIPVVVKLFKRNFAGEEEFELKCRQIFYVLPLNAPKKEEKHEALELPVSEAKPKQEEALEVDSQKLTTGDSHKNKTSPTTRISAEKEKPSKNILEKRSAPKEIAKQGVSEVPEEQLESISPKEEKKRYCGIICIDFGTTNSVVVVRDPHFAAEEIKEELGQEQWETLRLWVSSWLIKHLSAGSPDEADLFVEEITRYLPQIDIPPCGSSSEKISTKLTQMNDSMRQQFVEETISALSNLDPQEVPPEILVDLGGEVLKGFESSIYSKNLDNQRYFVLELDENAGAGPIASAIQIISAPHSEDKQKQDTKIEMGLRVSLLMRSATMGDADIKQFSLAIKRYFGRNEAVDLVPSEAISGGEVAFTPDNLCFLAYKSLIQRSLQDIQSRAEKNEFQSAEIPGLVVATFPTTYPASLRRKLRDLLKELDLIEVDTRFDEGSASLIYYVWREVCADPICGMHGLMARCRQDRHGRPYQNILLYDLGGGTTDIALIQLIYEILPVFEPIDKTASKGGCYFRITPRLLGSTGHRYIGGDLVTLWLFRFVKTKLADVLLTLLSEKEIDPPVYSPLTQIVNNLEANFLKDDQYRKESLLDWTYSPIQNIRQYDILNENTIDKLIPTRFQDNPAHMPIFFTLWHLTEEAKKYLGTPVSCYPGSGLGQEWPEKFIFNSEQLWGLLIAVHPWLEEEAELKIQDIQMCLTQEEMNRFAKGPIVDSLTLALNLAQARLQVEDSTDKLDRLILSGFSCNMKTVQEETRTIFTEKTENLFRFSLSNVSFERDLAKTSVALGACIGRYLESVRLHPEDERTRQMLREGYDQVEMVVENLFTYLTCRLVYDSLVAMVTMFNYGQELNKRSYLDGKAVARTSMNDLRPVQEKFWVYRVDFDGAEPLYLGVVDAEAVTMDYGIEDFRKFREDYKVGFETDVELFVRAFFIPKGPKNILARDFMETQVSGYPVEKMITKKKDGKVYLSHSISSQELFNRKVVIAKETEMIDTIEYPDGSRYRCVISPSLPIREIYDFYLEALEEEQEPGLIGHFHLWEQTPEEAYLACDENGRIILLFSVIYDIKIWADIDYVPQRIDVQYDPFCGLH